MVTTAEHKEVVDSLKRIESVTTEIRVDHSEKLGRLDEHLKVINGTLRDNCDKISEHETMLQRLVGSYNTIKVAALLLSIILTVLTIRAFFLP